MTDISWRCAEILASSSGRRVAFVEDATGTAAPPPNSGSGHLIARIGWYKDDEFPDTTPITRTADEKKAFDVQSAALGESIADLRAHFDFVIVNACAPTRDELISLAREVEGVIILIFEEHTLRRSAALLVDQFRGAGVHLLGAVFVSSGITAAVNLNFRG